MKRRDFTAGLALTVLAPAIARAAPTIKMQETPSLADQVKAGSLPAVDKRIPDAPSIVKRFAGADGVGKPGGEVNMGRATPAASPAKGKPKVTPKSAEEDHRDTPCPRGVALNKDTQQSAFDDQRSRRGHRPLPVRARRP